MTRGNIIRLPLWLALGMALGVALGPLVDTLRGAAPTAWAAAGATTARYPNNLTRVAGGTFTTWAYGNVSGDATACPGSGTSTNSLADTSLTTGQVETYNTFGFTASDVPLNSTIDGITVTLVAMTSAAGGTQTLGLQLVNGAGTAVGAPSQGVVTLNVTEKGYTLGGTADTWGAALTQADIVSASFGVRVTSTLPADKVISLYCLNVAVNYTPPANIQIRDINEVYTASGITGSLTATFTQNTQTIYAGYIDVTNALPAAYGNFDTGYTLANLESGNAGPGPDADLSAALKVEVDVRNVADTCGASPVLTAANIAAATPASGGTQIKIVAAGTAWATLSTANRAAINANSAQERLCFYLTITGAPDTIVGGTLSYNLTFTAN